MMPMYYDEKCGPVATNSHTWIKSINRFINPDERNNAAQIAYNRFRDLYSMEKDATNLINVIEKIQSRRK
jgi:spore maturation protein CgeB